MAVDSGTSAAVSGTAGASYEAVEPSAVVPGAVFLDKDGTLIEDVPYNVDPQRVRLVRGAQAALRRLGAAGLPIVVVSNQSGVARGYFNEEALIPLADCLRRLIEAEGAMLLDFRYCPHLPDGLIGRYAVECDCRKPKPGLLLAAARAHQLSLPASWMVGDILDDVEAGAAAGCRTILVDNGHETEWRITGDRIPDHLVADLEQAADVILRSRFAEEVPFTWRHSPRVRKGPGTRRQSGAPAPPVVGQNSPR